MKRIGSETTVLWKHEIITREFRIPLELCMWLAPETPTSSLREDHWRAALPSDEAEVGHEVVPEGHAEHSFSPSASTSQACELVSEGYDDSEFHVTSHGSQETPAATQDQSPTVAGTQIPQMFPCGLSAELLRHRNGECGLCIQYRRLAELKANLEDASTSGNETKIAELKFRCEELQGLLGE